MFDYIEDAIQREKSLKEWPRQWKINLIERLNPHWQDLFPAMQRFDPPQASGAGRGMDPGHPPGLRRGRLGPG
jgi:hypothetical protein